MASEVQGIMTGAITNAVSMFGDMWPVAALLLGLAVAGAVVTTLVRR